MTSRMSPISRQVERPANARRQRCRPAPRTAAARSGTRHALRRRRQVFVAEERKRDRGDENDRHGALQQQIDAASGITLGQQKRDADRQRADREDDAADPGGAFEPGRHDDGEQRNQGPAARRSQPRQDQHRKHDAAGRGQVLRRPARLKDPGLRPRLRGQRAPEKMRPEHEPKNGAERGSEAEQDDQAAAPAAGR